MIVLCRHGSTQSNVAGVFLSRHDPPLNDFGREQAERAAAQLAPLSLQQAFSSPMLRCIQTLEIVAASVPRTMCDALREIDFGSWEGRTMQWLEQHDPIGVTQRRSDPATFRPPNGENFFDVAQRLQPLAKTLRAASARSTLVLAHRGSLGVLERLLRELPIDSRAVAPLEPGQFRVLT